MSLSLFCFSSRLKWWYLVFDLFPRKDEWLCAALDCLLFLPDPPVVELCRELPHCFPLDHNRCEPSTFAEGTCEYQKRGLSTEKKLKVLIQISYCFKSHYLTRLGIVLAFFGPEKCFLQKNFESCDILASGECLCAPATGGHGAEEQPSVSQTGVGRWKLLLFDALVKHYSRTDRPPLLPQHMTQVYTAITDLLGD